MTRKEIEEKTGATYMENAQIKSVRLGFENHGLLTLDISLSLEGNIGTCYGGWNMTNNPKGMSAVGELLKAMKVDSLNELEKTYCRTLSTGNGCGDRVMAIGHIIEDSWFSFQEFFKRS